ncbi:MAG: IS30 family transposase [Clostridia bacterium]
MKNSHLTLEDRKKIQEGLEKGLSRTEIAKNINKDISTVAKEIKNKRKLKPRNPFNNPITCTKFKECRICHGKCSEYEEIKCTRRDRKVGVCNLCPDISKCRLDKYFYYAKQAHESYLYTLKDSREGVNLNTTEMLEIVDIIKPLLKQGQSIYQILKNHPEIKMCSKTLYMYIESGIFQDYGINNFSLRRQVAMRKRKKLKKRKEPVNYEGRRYKDYLEFVKENPIIPTTQMDTVYNQQDGPYIQTFIFQNTGLMIGFLHTEKTSESMASTLDNLQETLKDDYQKLFSLLLTDRGSEFEKYELFEVNAETGEIRSNIFYCDPQTPSQKPHVENNHNYVRDIIPNGKSLKNLTQEDLNLMFSHINSTPRKVLNGKTPYEAFEFLYGNEILEKLNIRKIAKDMVTLQPYLLKIK